MTSKKGPPPVVYLIILIVLGFGGYQAFTQLTPQNPPNGGNEAGSEEEKDNSSSDNSDREQPDPPPENPRLSRGENILIDVSSDQTAFFRHKEKGTQAMSAGNYTEAVQQFEAALAEKRNSPETLVYLNNARIGEQKAYQVAVTLPIDEDTVSFALEMLRGYAQAQQEINQAGGINGIPLKLVIADEDDDPEIAKQVVQDLANKEDILAVTGHWSSSTTIAVAEVYNRNQLVLVNPVSSSTKISGISDYVFRTIPSNYIVGATMAEYALNEFGVENLAIFYDSSSAYSLSLRQELKTALLTRGGSVVAEADFNSEGFLPRTELEGAKTRGASAIALIPSTDIDRALQVVNVNARELPLLGDLGNLYGVKTLDVGGEDAVGMAIPIPWHIQNPGSEAFVQTSRQLWGADVNWATVMAYEAMSAIAQALAPTPNPTREDIQDTLANNGFSAPGVLQPVKFLPSGDRDGRVIMVEVQPANPSRSGTGYDFVPVN